MKTRLLNKLNLDSINEIFLCICLIFLDPLYVLNVNLITMADFINKHLP